MPRMKRSWSNGIGRILALGVLMLTLSPAAALGQRDQVERDIVDARLEGYSEVVTLPPASNGLTWVALIVLGAICVGGLFKDARRTHLD